jgi:hypothetical protein
MSAGIRRGVSIVVAAAFVAAVFVWFGQHVKAQEAVTLTSFETELKARHAFVQAEIKKAAEALSVSAQEASRDPLFNTLTATALKDDAAFRQTLNNSLGLGTTPAEPIWSDYLKRYRVLISLGDTVYFSSAPELDSAVEPLRKDAQLGARSFGLVESNGKMFLVGGAPIPQVAVDGSRAVLLLATDLKESDLSVMMAPEESWKLGVSEVGSGPSRQLLDEYAKSKTGSCCYSDEISKGILLTVSKSPDGPLAIGRKKADQMKIPAIGVAALLSAIALFLGFRPKKEGLDTRETKMLLETATQLRQSQDELRRMTSQIMTPNRTERFGANAPEPHDDGLGSTQSSMVPSRYEVVAPLGEGGMAKVSVAVLRGAEGFKRYFVLKRLRAEIMGNQEAVNQFIDEARLGASLINSNIVPVFDFGRDAEGYYLAQEYILGRDVDAMVTRSKELRGIPLEVPVVLYIAQEALKALAYAHNKANEAGRALELVHRDVSPNNLMVSINGEIKLLDFGIVKSEDRVTQTQAGMVKGNLFFMSPEQAKALPVDKRSDLFSLGMVLYYAATGQTIYSGNTSYDLMVRAADGLTESDKAKVSALPQPLAELIARALALDPNERYPDAETFAKAISIAGGAATGPEVQQLMTGLFKEQLEADRLKFMGQNA